MTRPTTKTVCLVGMGTIGRSWMHLFTGAGCRICIYDPDPFQSEKALEWFEKALKQDVREGFSNAHEAEESRALASMHTDLKGALSGAEYIQESTPERIEIKRAIFTQIDKSADPTAIIASSTSSLDINDICIGLPGVSRCIMAHPYNPPHVNPVVEILPAKQTDPEVTRQAIEFLESVGQVPVLMNFYTVGFLGNRIQAAVIREAIHLVESGAADVEGVDAVICQGLGLRWALFGNFGVNNTNADGGIREYYDRYSETLKAIMNALDSTAPSFNHEMIEKIAVGVDAMEGKAPMSEICKWRDRLIRKIRVLKEQDPHP